MYAKLNREHFEREMSRRLLESPMDAANLDILYERYETAIEGIGRATGTQPARGLTLRQDDVNDSFLDGLAVAYKLGIRSITIR